MSEPKDLPDGWDWATVDDLCHVGTGTTPSRTEPRYWSNGSVPWITSSAVNQLSVSEAGEFVTQDALGETTLKLYPKHTLILALYGEGKTRGKVSELLIDATINQALAALQMPGESAKCRPFLKAFLQGHYATLRRQAAGGMQPNLNLGLVKRIRVPVAPLSEQLRIVAKIEELFSDLDAGVAALKRAKANLKRYRAAVLKAAVEGKLTEQWRAEHPNTEPASKLLERILVERRKKWEADQLAKFAAAGKEPPKNWRERYVEPTTPDTCVLPVLAQGWCWSSVEQLTWDSLIGLDYGRQFQTSDGVGCPYLKMQNVTMDGHVLPEDLVFVPATDQERQRFTLLPGDLLFNTRNSLELVGKIGIVNEVPLNAVFNNNLLRLRVSINPEYMCYWMCSSRFRRMMALVKKATTNVAAVYAKDLFSLPVAVPPQPEQSLIVTEVAESFSQIEAAGDAIDRGLLRAGRLRQSILKQAFEGKLVAQDPTDEPASALLERLRESRSVHESNGSPATSAQTRGRRVKRETSGDKL